MNKFKYRILSGILTLAMIAISIPINVYAEKDYTGDGGGNTGGSSTGYTWTESQQGYRITVVDKDGQIVAGPVDYIYSDAPRDPNVIESYGNSKLSSLENMQIGEHKTVNIDEMLESPGFNKKESMPAPILWENGRAIGNGAALREWLLKGGDFGGYPSGGSKDYNWENQGNTSGGSGSSGNINYKNNTTEQLLDKLTSQQYKEILIYMTEVQYELIIALTFVTTPIGSGDTYLPPARAEEYIRGQYLKALGIVATQVNSIQYELIKRGSSGNYTAILGRYDSWLRDKLRAPVRSDIDTPLSNKIEFTGNKIPLADEATNSVTDDGYMNELLNYKDKNNSYYLKTTLTAEAKEILDREFPNLTPEQRYETSAIIKAAKHTVLIEPILWYTPVNLANQRYSKVVYGTITNHAQWAVRANSTGKWNDGGSGGNMAVLSNYTGPWSLYLDSGVMIGGNIISTPSGSVGSKVTNATIMNMAYGYALHAYTPFALDLNGTHTWDYAEGDNPAPAPVWTQPTSYTGKSDVNIVKCYEDNGTHVGTYTRSNNPGLIKIEDEQSYKIKEWVIAREFASPGFNTTYTDAIRGVTKAQNGVSPANVNVDGTNTTLYIRLEKSLLSVADGDLTIGESQISKAVDTSNSKIPNWGPKTFTFTYGSMAGSDSHDEYVGKDEKGNDIYESSTYNYHMADSSYSYNFKNMKSLNNSLVANVGIFKPLNTVGFDASGSNASIGGGTNRVNSFNYQMVLWRGKDIPTLAKYKENNATTQINGLLGKLANTPIGKRFSGITGYNENLSVTLAKDASNGDYETYSRCSGCAARNTATHECGETQNYSGVVTIKSYSGKNHKLANQTVGKMPLLPYISVTGNGALEGSGVGVQSKSIIKFYPYINMTYQTPGKADNDRANVSVLSEWLAQIIPTDYAEAGFYNAKPEASLNLKSNQWSLHQRAINPIDKQGNLLWSNQDDTRKNSVLPGGAIYTIDTSGTESFVSAVTWQTYIEGPNRQILAGAISGDEYTTGKANTEHQKYADQVKNVLEDLRIVQWVDTNNKASTAFGGKAILGGGQSLAGFGGLTGKTNTEAKYYLKAGSPEDKANEGDIDVMGSSTKTVYFRVSSDTSGNIKIDRSTVSDFSSNVANVQTLSKNQGADSLTGQAKELDDRTKIVTNFINAIERNTGNDRTAAWAPDGKWYNEAWDGVYIARNETTYKVGLSKSGIRSAALDPALCPPNTGVADLFSKAFLSQFRMNNKSDANIAQGKPENYIGTFKGTDVIMDGMENIFVSKKFWIPNVNVQDLH